MVRKTKHEVGNIIGDFTIIEKLGLQGERNMKWRCICNKCGSEAIKRSHTLSTARYCNHFRNHHRSKAVGEIPGSYWSAILRSAKARNIDVCVTAEYIWSLFLEQGGKCALTQLPLTFKSERKNRPNGTASLDRKDSTKGYTGDNIWWVHKDVNIMRNNYSIQEFANMCRLVTENWDNVGIKVALE